MRNYLILLFLISSLYTSCDKDDNERSPLSLTGAFAGSTPISFNGAVTSGIPVDQSIYLTFSSPIDRSTTASSISLSASGSVVDVEFTFMDNDKGVLVRPEELLTHATVYTLIISNQLTGARKEKFEGITLTFKTISSTLTITSFMIGDQSVTSSNRLTDVALDLAIVLDFSAPIDQVTLNGSVQLTGPGSGSLITSLSNENKTLTISRTSSLQPFGKYTFTISSNLKGVNDEPFAGITQLFYAAADPTPKFPVITDDELLTLVQEQTFKYFWDFAHPNSGMARERNTSGDLVTSGGSGFGIMAMIVAMERNFITRQQGLDRMDRILDFLETADRFHGAWSHWINGNTGAVIPFGTNDNGGDLVETSFLIQGLLTFRQYLNSAAPDEQLLIDRINTLWHSVEWDWYTQNGQDVLYWHWSPDKEWIMNFPIRGYNEALITYVLAASSPTHSIDKEVYDNGWTRNGDIVNNQSFYNINLPLGYDYGGPLFFAHYSFLGLDPRNLTDTYTDYWTQNVHHTQINRMHSVINPKNFVGYSEACWGLTASDNHQGYSAHSPTNDLGVITPTAALSSFPYTPEYSMEALKFFYYTIGNKLWGDYGFYDAFNITEQWYANSYLAIDQGPIIVMIENHRTGLLWDLFMSCPEVQDGLTDLGFTY